MSIGPADADALGGAWLGVSLGGGTLADGLRDALDVGWQAAVLTGNPPLGLELGLKAKRTHTMFNGPIECRLLRYELY